MKNKLLELRVWLCQRTPYHLQWAIDKFGVTFPYNGDHIVWIWPWGRKGQAPFISTALSTQELVRFDSLAEYRDTLDQIQQDLMKQFESFKTQVMNTKFEPGNN